jgi:hypothetical protein
MPLRKRARDFAAELGAHLRTPKNLGRDDPEAFDELRVTTGQQGRRADLR